MNASGQLGYEDIINRGNVVNQMGDYLPFVDVNAEVNSINAGFTEISYFI